MGPQIRNRYARIAVYILVIVMMVGHLILRPESTKLMHFLDIFISLMAAARLWIEFHDNE